MGKLGSDMPDELWRLQDRLPGIRSARKEMDAEAAAATTRQEENLDKTAVAGEVDAPSAEQKKLNRKSETAPLPGKLRPLRNDHFNK
jgi:hypothetical protein